MTNIYNNTATYRLNMKKRGESQPFRGPLLFIVGRGIFLDMATKFNLLRISVLSHSIKAFKEKAQKI